MVYFTHLSLVLSVRYRLFTGKKRVIQWRHQGRLSKGRDAYPSDGQTLLQCHQNQLRPCACVYAELQESSISRMSWSFVKEFAVSSYRWGYVQLGMLTQDKSTKLWELHYTPGVVGLVKSLNKGLWLHIRIHFTPLNQEKDKGNPKTKTPIWCEIFIPI